MPSRILQFTIVLLVLLCDLSVASAQLFGRRRDRDRDRVTASQPPQPEVFANDTQINPVHEKIKTQSSEAYQKGDYQRAIDLASRVLGESRTDDVAYYLRGTSRVELGVRTRDSKLIRRGIADAREAVVHAEDKAASAMYYIPYMHGMTSLAKLENRKEHAEVSVQVGTQVLQSKDVKPLNKANLYYQRAAAYLVLEKSAEAARDFESALEIDNSHLGSYMALPEAYAQAGEAEKARTAYDKAAEIFENSPLVYNNRGMFLQRQGQLDAAIADFEKAIELDGDFTVAYVNRGYCQLRKGDYAAAEKSFDAALEKDADLLQVYDLRGTVHIAQGRVQAAVQDYERLLRKQPRNASVHADLGFARFYAGDYRSALRSLDQAVQIDPTMEYLDSWRYWCLVELGRQDEARRRFETSLTAAAKDRDWVDHLIAYMAGETEAADLLLAVDVEDAERDPAQRCEAHFFMGRKLAHAGETKAAVENYRKAVETGAEHLSAYRGARIALGRLDVAVETGDTETE